MSGWKVMESLAALWDSRGMDSTYAVVWIRMLWLWHSLRRLAGDVGGGRPYPLPSVREWEDPSGDLSLLCCRRSGGDCRRRVIVWVLLALCFVCVLWEQVEIGGV